MTNEQLVPSSQVSAGAVAAFPTLSVIVPAYREAENLELLIPQIFAHFHSRGIDGEVIVVDDDSQDGTREICTRLAEDYAVKLIVRVGERGLSSAVVCGLRAASGRILVVMDADLSHPADSIADIAGAVESGADFAIGSRYVSGGETEEGWGLYRWLNSKVATLLARPLVRCQDPMAGFFAIAKDRFTAAENLDPIGYKIGLELIVKCNCRRIEEIPITFRDRVHGESKLTLREQFNYLTHLKRLYEFRLGRLARPFQFALVGATGMAVDLSIFSLLLLILPSHLARAMAIVVAMSWNFFLNRRLTFSYARHQSAVRQYVLFCAACSVGAVVNWAVSFILWSNIEVFSEHKLAAAICGIVAGTVFNYALSSIVVFARRSEH